MVITALQGSAKLCRVSSVSLRNVDLLSLLITVGRFLQKSPPSLEVELESLSHMLLPCFEAGQQGRDAHDVPGLPI